MTHQSTQKHGRDMTIGSIPRHLIAFSLPMLAGNVIQALYGFVNAFWVGKKLGETELAAVTDSMPIIFLLMAVAMGLTMGTGILVSQFAGAREWDRLKKTIQTSTVLLMLLGAVCVGIGLVYASDIMRLTKAPPDVFPMAVSYLRISIISIPAIFLTFLVASALRGIGDSKTPLYFQASALVATAIFDPILMFGWLGFPRFGLNGTAIASTAWQWVAVMALTVYLARKKHIASPDWRRLSIDLPTLWQLLIVALPSMVQYSLVSLGMAFVITIINGFGDTAAAAFGAGMVVDQIAFMPALTFGGAVSMLVGQNIGAGQAHRAKEVFRWGILICGGITLALAILAATFPHFMLSIFLNEGGAVTIGVNYLRIVAISYVFFAVLFVSNGVINGAGYTFVTTIVTLVGLWAARVPLAVYLSHRMHAVEGVFYAMTISNAISMIISLTCYYSGFWKKPIIRHRTITPPSEGVAPFPAIE